METMTLTLGRRSLHQLRSALERSLGVQAAPLLQEAGFASGEAMTGALQAHVREHFGVERLQDLDEAYFGEALSGFFAAQGWGELTRGRSGRGGRDGGCEGMGRSRAGRWSLSVMPPLGGTAGGHLLATRGGTVRGHGGGVPEPGRQSVPVPARRAGDAHAGLRADDARDVVSGGAGSLTVRRVRRVVGYRVTSDPSLLGMTSAHPPTRPIPAPDPAGSAPRSIGFPSPPPAPD